MIPHETVAGSPSSAQPRPSQPVVPAWLPLAIAMHRDGLSHAAIGRAFGASRRRIRYLICRELYPHAIRRRKPVATIREPEPPAWLDGPREPVAFLTPHRAIIYTEPEVTNPIAGLYISR